jgi:A/G-specific adenine glycosylase
VRRVVARALGGTAEAGPPATARDLSTVEAVLPPHRASAAKVSIALMELGALICTARSPHCTECPIAAHCAWRLAGYPDYAGPRTRPQKFTGTDRQVRGRLLDVLRTTTGPVTQLDLEVPWHDPSQRQRALESLVTDGLIDPLPDGTFALPS